jgi:hypothetical protein
MRKTYTEAAKVLVVETYLTQHAASAMSPREKVLRVYCSTWASRLWTLQEGYLARSLMIQFADQAELLLDLFHRLDADPICSLDFHRSLFSFFLNYFPRDPTFPRRG